MTDNLDGQLSMFAPDSASGRMSPEHSAPTAAKTSNPSSRSSSASQNRALPMCLCLTRANGQKQDASTMNWADGALLGAYTMLSFGECPNEENASRLSQILEVSPHSRFSLSAKACAGILNRAARRGKTLPAALALALHRQCSTDPITLTNASMDISGALRAQEHGHQPCVMAVDCRNFTESEINGTLQAKSNGGMSLNLNNVIRAETYNQISQSAVYKEDAISGSLTVCGGSYGGGSKVLCVEMTSTKNTVVENGICPTLTARMATGGNQVNAVLETYQSVTGPLMANSHPGSYTGQDAYNDMLIAHSLKAIVRRLTPLECERLQGFPDNWTDIGEWTDSKGKKHKPADSPRYKALGNSIALPFWQYLARRICAQYERDITMASLFDGIGGFPLVFERCGAKAVWASEIEEFPMAVTRERFKEA